ncbi:MAG: ABC transporter permease [Longimicrobiales bacterium]
MDRFRQDLRFALRRLYRQPGFALVAVVTLALGIGANTAIFSVVRGVLLEPPPYEDPANVVMVWQSWRGSPETWVSGPEVLDFREGVTSFTGVGAYATGAINLTEGSEPERVAVAQVSANVFDLLGVTMAAGRPFTVEEDVQGNDGVVVLTYGLWQRRFGGDRGVVGRELRLSGQPRTVVGVLSEGVRLPFDYETDRPAEMWLPLTLTPANAGSRGSHGLYGVARLAPGATVERANEELGAIVRRWIDEGLVHAEAQYAPFAVPVMEHVLRGVRPALYVLLGAVAFVLLIACANVANLLLARSDGRLREVALRSSLGAGRSRVLLQLMTESVVLAMLGGVMGSGLAWAGLQLVVALDPSSVPRLEDVRLDGVVLGFTAAIALATGVLFGIIPALQLLRSNLAGVLKEGTRTMTAGRARRQFRQFLVATEVALSVMLVIGAGLMMRSFVELRSIDVGFEPAGILTARLSLPSRDYPDAAGVADFYARLVARASALPGAVSAGAVRLLPLQTTMGDWSIEVEGRPSVPGDNPHGDWQVVTPGYFETMGLDLEAGRFLEAGDRADALPVVVINETMANEYWPGESAIGKRFRMGGDDGVWFTIVGVVRDIRHGGVTEAPRTEMYHAHDQFRIAAGFTPAAMTLVIAAAGDPLALAGPLRAAVRAMDANVPLADIATMEHVTSRALSEPRFMTLLLGAFAMAALVLAAIGIYGVISYGVTQRTHEIGIRMALGADRRRIVRMVVASGAGAVFTGIALGVVSSLFVTNLLERMLYSVSRLDAVTFVAVPLILAAVAVVASLLPARRAAGVDPLIALRYE